MAVFQTLSPLRRVIYLLVCLCLSWSSSLIILSQGSIKVNINSFHVFDNSLCKAENNLLRIPNLTGELAVKRLFFHYRSRIWTRWWHRGKKRWWWNIQIWNEIPFYFQFDRSFYRDYLKWIPKSGPLSRSNPGHFYVESILPHTVFQPSQYPAI